MAGRFVKGTTDEPEESTSLGRKGVRNPRFFKTFARKQFAEALPVIVSVLLDKAKSGSVSHLKLLVELSGLEKDPDPKKMKPRGKSLEAILTEQWAKDKAEAALKPATGGWR
ncbi:hypothetical protein AciX9_0030 [Granulicella tundricola MP5ACTX9]|uniref:Uncharacterized protein n=1 Tax=Granulicella tundricola (strain ATCC BAA-1859 / DSM 23138 / MP5ACTX9) TaxID=1198114 RepID=E8X461_GRATM|nr:hypothetical protein AciX9_0030 [Granulicella tundricola MP5ACTX9]